MLEKPELQDAYILSRLQDEYGLHPARVTFLPLGADVNTAVYRVDSQDGPVYFLKLRKGDFNQITVRLPQLLKAQGVQAILPPVETRAQQGWGILGAYKMILYPFVQGEDGYKAALSDQQWLDFGAALKGIHAAQIPPEFMRLIPRETYSPHWREMVKAFQVQIEQSIFDDPVAAKLAAFMRARQNEISHVVERAEQLGHALQARSLDWVVCHSDIHPGNLLITGDDGLYIVDWDNPMLAPKERDLTLVGGCTAWSGAQGEALFYQAYGPAQVDRIALAYYRYERIVQDIAEFCKQLLLTNEGKEDREQSYLYFTSSFLPGHEIELADEIDMAQTD